MYDFGFISKGGEKKQRNLPSSTFKGTVSSGLMMITTPTQNANWDILICSWERGHVSRSAYNAVVIYIIIHYAIWFFKTQDHSPLNSNIAYIYIFLKMHTLIAIEVYMW